MLLLKKYEVIVITEFNILNLQVILRIQKPVLSRIITSEIVLNDEHVLNAWSSCNQNKNTVDLLFLRKMKI